MSAIAVKLAKIGDKLQSGKTTRLNRVIDDEFFWAGASYKILIDVDISKVIKDVNAVPAFKLQKIDDGTTESVWLLFQPDLLKLRERSGRYLRATKSLVETFFLIEQEYLFTENDDDDIIENAMTVEPTEQVEAVRNDRNNDIIILPEGDDDDDDDDGGASVDSGELPIKIIDELYQQLREAHREHKPLEDYPDEYIQHKDLRPKLTNYQIDGVKWMLNRERKIEYFPTEFEEVARRYMDAEPTTKFFYNDRTFTLTVNKNDDVAIPRGGILADAMGLGKTVEMLDLILMNRRVVPETSTDQIQMDDILEHNTPQVVRCLCTKKANRPTVECTRCFMLQHRECVSQRDSPATPDAQYKCPTCWQNEEPLKAKTTFIVSPTSIKLQWRDEVIKHVNDENFKVLVYYGVKSSSWMNPMELASYDIILTDYVTLQSEFYYCDHNPTTRTLRRPSRYLKIKTPLLFVNWWRVCLDEAQMVSSVITKPHQLVAQLSAVHRWAVTGTPIQRAIDDLYGLICFLGCSPFDEREKWLQLTNEFTYAANIRALVELLQRIMWRTCKSKEIMDQVNIPEQTECIHYVNMTDLEQFHYKREHARCSTDFHRNSIKIGAKQKLATLNPHMLNLVLEPLRKLRQDCTIPSVLERNLGQSKKNLKPDELLKHLTAKNEIEAKTELRTITSSINGIAALHVIRNEPVEAAKMYKSVLKWAKDYNEKISVDSLLQIHAISNLMEIDSSIGVEERTAYDDELNQLEAKYLDKNVNLVMNVQLDQKKWEQKIDEIQSNLVANEYEWWMNALKHEERNPSNLIRKIMEELIQSYEFQQRDLPFSTVDGICFVLTLWMDKILEERENLQKTFEQFQFYIDNFKPISQIDPKHREKMQKFLNQAYECHLNLNKKPEEEVPPKKRKKNDICELCLARIQMEAYECIIFDMKMMENSEVNTRGSWKHSYQEAILKIILSHIRNLDIYRKEDGKVLLQLLDAYKQEFKEYRQLWVEVNFTVSAYDELKMCKSRTQAVDPLELEDESEMESNLIISKYEVDEKMEELRVDIRQAELNFLRKLGQLKYLGHLRKNNQVENCPICDTPPGIKYVVLECGHHLCMKCWITWQRTIRSERKNNSIFSCCICRHQQSKHNLYYVTLQTEEQLTDSSSKVEAIAKEIKKLTKADPTVKIVIFSQWTHVLNILEEALVQTNISFRSRLGKFYQTIKEFKDPDMNVTCLLLPLSYGSKGLNLIEATHVFFVEPILDTGEEAQAIGRIHRIGQTKETYVHRFIVINTIEETIHNTISNDSTGFWSSRKCTVENLMELFTATDTDDV